MTRQKSILLLALAALGGASAPASAADRPERLAFPFREAVSAAGTYEAATVGTNFVVSGTISGALTFAGEEPYRVTLRGATVTKAMREFVDEAAFSKVDEDDWK